MIVYIRKSVNWLRSDGEGQYDGSPFQKGLAERGNAYDLRGPYSPESNGRDQRLNRTLLDIARRYTESYQSSGLSFKAKQSMRQTT